MGRKICYVVLRGRSPGIYHTWAECSDQVTGFSGALYHGCESIEAAQRELAAFIRPHNEVRRTTTQMEQIKGPCPVDDDNSLRLIKLLVTVVLVLLIAVMLKYLTM